MSAAAASSSAADVTEAVGSFVPPGLLYLAFNTFESIPVLYSSDLEKQRIQGVFATRTFTVASNKLFLQCSGKTCRMVGTIPESILTKVLPNTEKDTFQMDDTKLLRRPTKIGASEKITLFRGHGRENFRNFLYREVTAKFVFKFSKSSCKFSLKFVSSSNFNWS